VGRIRGQTAVQRARHSLEGLSLGDAFGEIFYQRYPGFDPESDLPSGPWRWTDDTHMAISIVEILSHHSEIEQDALAEAFARRYLEDPDRGYGRGAHRLLRRLATGADWREAAPALFHGGSYGNGAAMRAAPIGAYFAGDPERAASEARKSALITHAHPEGQAGAMAVAVAATLVASGTRPGATFLERILAYLPETEVARGIQASQAIPVDEPYEAYRQLGTGQRVSAQDSVPFCLWIAAHHLGDYQGALWTTAFGLGDCDTTCAIVGGILALSVENLPGEWLARREVLPRV
jgi:ADP-ribosylglycohydrolase